VDRSGREVVLEARGTLWQRAAHLVVYARGDVAAALRDPSGVPARLLLGDQAISGRVKGLGRSSRLGLLLCPQAGDDAIELVSFNPRMDPIIPGGTLLAFSHSLDQAMELHHLERLIAALEPTDRRQLADLRDRLEVLAFNGPAEEFTVHRVAHLMGRRPDDGTEAPIDVSA